MALRWSSCVGLRYTSRQRCVQRSRVHVPSTRSFVFNGCKTCYSSSVELLPRLFSTSSRQYDSRIVVRVPPMAESITEGTLNQFNKLVGDFIELDEELATIETDKIDVSVNAPQSGVIKQLLVGEGDVVTVDQEIAEIEAGEQVTTQSEKSKDPA